MAELVLTGTESEVRLHFPVLACGSMEGCARARVVHEKTSVHIDFGVQCIGYVVNL